MAKTSQPRRPSLAERRAAIDRAWGMLRPKPGELPFAEQMTAWKDEERALEKRRDDFLASIGGDKPLDMEALQKRLKRLSKKRREPPAHPSA
jgi:hypothetical protein